MPKTTAMLLILAVSGSTSLGQQIEKKRHNARSYPPTFTDARAEIYKQLGDVKLNLYVFTPPNHRSSDRRPAIVFFSGADGGAERRRSLKSTAGISPREEW